MGIWARRSAQGRASHVRVARLMHPNAPPLPTRHRNSSKKAYLHTVRGTVPRYSTVPRSLRFLCVLRGPKSHLTDDGYADNGGTTWSVRFDGRAAHHWIPASHLERVAGTHNRVHRSATPPRSHTVLVIDNSGSMKNQDVQPGVAGGGGWISRHCSL